MSPSRPRSTRPARPPSADWVVAVRDLSDRVHIDGQASVFVAIIIDAPTGLVPAAGVGETVSEARRSALRSAVAQDEVPLATRLVCPPGTADEVRADLAAATAGTITIPVLEQELPGGVEVFLDAMAAHFGGPPVPEDEPTDDQWDLLVSRTLEYARAQPWLQWPDDLQLRTQVRVDGRSSSFVAAVIGREGLQAGLVLYPGTRHSDVPVPDDDWEPSDPLPFRDGSLLLHLNPPDDTIEAMAQVALDHGWPPDETLSPVWLSAGPGGFAELGSDQAVRLSVALAGVLARHRRTTKSGRITGTVALPGGGEASYTVTDLPLAGLR